MKFIDLFAGIGGFHYGIEKCNRRSTETPDTQDRRVKSNSQYSDGNGGRTDAFTCVYANEWDKYANSVYRAHFGECDQTDIKKVAASSIPDHDLLCGGFPCQSFSIAGKRGGFDDTRGTLFFDIARILKEKQPRLCLLENVKGLLSHDNGRTIKVILTTLTELGYDVQWQVCNSKDFGVPQNRERIFIVGHLRGTPRPEVFPLIPNGGTDNGIPRYIANTLTSRYEGAQATGTYIGEGELNAQGKSGRQGVQQKRNKPDHTDSGRWSTYSTSIRRLTPIECERLQGFPDNWTQYGADGELISDTQRYKMCGNAVTTNVITEIVRRLI